MGVVHFGVTLATVIHLEVADDMHRMADYVSDFRTITYAGIVFSIIGALVFLIVKYRNKQNKPVPRGGEPSRQFQVFSLISLIASLLRNGLSVRSLISSAKEDP